MHSACLEIMQNYWKGQSNKARSGSQVSGAGTKTILVDTENKLESSTQYYIQIDESAFLDLAGNSYSGINDKNSLSFTTADVTPPTLSSSNPLDNDVDIGVSNNIELTFSEPVDAESGDIEIRKSLVEYDDVMNKQREIIYEMRNNALSGQHEFKTWENTINDNLNTFLEDHKNNTDINRFSQDVKQILARPKIFFERTVN